MTEIAADGACSVPGSGLRHNVTKKHTTCPQCCTSMQGVSMLCVPMMSLHTVSQCCVCMQSLHAVSPCNVAPCCISMLCVSMACLQCRCFLVVSHTPHGEGTWHGEGIRKGKDTAQHGWCGDATHGVIATPCHVMPRHRNASHFHASPVACHAPHLHTTKYQMRCMVWCGTLWHGTQHHQIGTCVHVMRPCDASV